MRASSWVVRSVHSAASVGAVAAVFAFSTACTSYDCATYTAFGYDFREQCGPLGAIGELFFEEQVATMLLGPSIDDFSSEEFSMSMEYGPMYDIAFDSSALDELGTATILNAECSRRECYDCWTEFFQATSAEVEVIEESNRTALGGKSWHIRWSIECLGEAQMSSTGDDVVEFSVQSTGYELDRPPYY